MEVIIFTWIISVIITSWIAKKKGQGLIGFFLGCLLGPIGIVIALASSSKKTEKHACKENKVNSSNKTNNEVQERLVAQKDALIKFKVATEELSKKIENNTVEQNTNITNDSFEAKSIVPHKNKLRDQFGIFVVLLSIIPYLVIAINSVFSELQNPAVNQRLYPIMTIAFILSFFVFHIYYKNKNYFGLVAIILGIYNFLYFTLEISSLELSLLLSPLFSIIYLIKIRSKIYKFTIIIPFLLTGFIILGFLFLILFLLQSFIIASLFFLIGYALYHSVKDNLYIFNILGKAKSYSLFLKTAVLWAPMLIVVIPGFYISSQLDYALRKTDDFIFSKANEAIQDTDRKVPEYLFNPNDLACGTFDVFCWISPARMIKKQINFQYRQYNLKDKTVKTTKIFFSNMMYLKEIFRNLLEMFLCISNILLYFITIRSFLYVFARAAISVKYNLPATLTSSDDNTIRKGHIRQCGHEYVISSTEPQKYYVVRTIEPSGRAPKISLPQWTGSPISRIIEKAYAMNEIEMKNGVSPVHFTSTGSQEFLEYNLEEGEEVIFSYKNFVAMSESVKLYTVISFRLTAMIFGKVLHSCVRGPGKVIFLTKGKAKCFEDGRMAGSIPINRIIAWQRNTKFDVESELNHFDVFLSGIYLKPSSPDMIIVDADEQGSPGNGLIKFVKRFLIPI